jgi:radical SAM superfamily enzyme YgiQ (UPF0313 family)
MSSLLHEIDLRERSASSISNAIALMMTSDHSLRSMTWIKFELFVSALDLCQIGQRVKPIRVNRGPLVRSGRLKLMARIACVYSVEGFSTAEQPLRNWNSFPFGLSIIASVLQHAGHEVRCWVICPATSLDRVAHEIVSTFRSDFVAANAVSTQFPIINRLLEAIKRIDPRLPTLLGGHHATLAPNDAIASPWVDALCIGEGEKAATAFALAIDQHRQPAAIPGLWIKIAGQINRTAPDKFNIELDGLPLVDRNHWARWVHSTDHSCAIVIGRGCPYVCSYCSNHALKDVTSGKFVRFRSPDNIVREISKVLADDPEMNFIHLEVETLGAMPKVAIELCNYLAEFNSKRASPIEFGANLSVTSRLVRNPERFHELLSAFRRANLTRINVGLESGSERIRNDILYRPRYSNDDIITFCKFAKQYGINVHLFILLGLPTETLVEYFETIRVARDCDPTGILPSIFYPYPGTQLFTLAAEMKLFDPTKIKVNAERSRAYLDIPGFPKWRIFFEYLIIHWRLFRGRWPMFRILGYGFRQFLTAFPGLMPMVRLLRNTCFTSTLVFKNVLYSPRSLQIAQQRARDSNEPSGAGSSESLTPL